MLDLISLWYQLILDLSSGSGSGSDQPELAKHNIESTKSWGS